MCGIVGIVSNRFVNQSIYDALTILQHRGQDAAGIMTCENGRLHLRKSNGLVRDAVAQRHMLRLKGNMGIGHVRYPTAGSKSPTESQPFYVNSPFGLSIVHNGNLVNSRELEQELHRDDLRHLNTHSDSEVLLNVFAHELQAVTGLQLQLPAIFHAVRATCRRLVGAYSVVIMINGYGLLAFRDPHGIRPLVYGTKQLDESADQETMIASETIPLDALGFSHQHDVKPGNAVFVDMQGRVHEYAYDDSKVKAPCLFEYIYLARSDSVLDRISVHQARRNMGVRLAYRILSEHPNHDIDVVIPIPDTSRVSALALAQQLQVGYSEGFVKNRYIGRTFIMPGQQARRANVRMKLNAVKEEFQGKNVLLVDDSIVRGTTSGQIIQMAREMGAQKVYFASAAPEVRYPNVYGIDIPNATELIAHERSVSHIAQTIGADWLVYQQLEDVKLAINQAAKSDADKIECFEDSIFTNRYVTGGVSEAYLSYIAKLRSDGAKEKRSELIDDGQECGISNEE